MHRRILVALAGTALLAAGLIAAPRDQPDVAPRAEQKTDGDTDLQIALDELLRDPAFDGSDVSLVVRDAETGESVYDHFGDSRMAPASNLKLFTAAAALEILGSDHRFATDVLATGPKRGHSLRGDLYLRGGGDPTTLVRDYRDLAREVAARGIRTVKGDLVTNDGHFGDVRLGRGWAWDDESSYYSAPTSALTVAPNTDYDPGTIIVDAVPGDSPGDRVRVAQTPRSGVFDIRNTATTGAAGPEDTLTIERDHGTNVVRVTGSAPAGGDATREWVTVWDPEAYAGAVFARALRREGVRVRGDVEAGTTRADARRIARHRSMTAAELMTPFLKLSNNMHAEALVKEIGAQTTGEGTWDDGLAGVTDYLESAGIDLADQRIVDGSGLSRMNNVTANAIANLLIAVRDEPWFDTYYEALPIAGNPGRFVGGTLRSRMTDTLAANNLHGKTGSLTGVSALSGYVTDADGRHLVFAMITNDYLDSPRAAEDAVGVTLASWSADDQPDAVSPKRFARAGVPDGVECSWVKAC